MMRCREAQYLISQLIDGETPHFLREPLKQHIKVCERCGRTYRNLFALESLLDESFEPFRRFRLPEDFNRGVMERVVQRAQGRYPMTRRAVRPAFAGLAVAGAAVALLALTLWLAGVHRRARVSAQRPIIGASAKPPSTVTAKQPGPQPLTGRRTAGVLWKVVGSFQLRSPLSPQWRSAKPGAAFRTGWEVRTSDGSRAKAGLTDGTVIKLNAHSLLVCASDRLQLKRGELWANVARSNVPLLIETPRGVFKVVGTELNLRTLERRDVLSVLKGRVILRTPHAEVPCEAGEQAIVLPREKPRVLKIKDPTEVLAWTDFKQAERLFASGQYQQAEEAYRQVVQAQPRNLTAQRRLFDTLERTADINVEVIGGDEVQTSGAETARGLFRYSLRSEAKKDLEASLAAVREVARGEPRNAKAQALLGYLLITQGDAKKASAHLKAAVRIEPHPADAHFSLAYLALNNREELVATQEIEEGLKRDPNSALGHVLKGIALSQKGHLKGAIEECQRAVAIEPSNADCHANVALMYWLKGDADKALREYVTAADLSPGSPYCVRKLVETYLQLGQAERAVEHLKRLSARARDNEMIYIGLGRAYRELGEESSAEPAFREARRLNDREPEPYIQLTDLYLKDGRYHAAVRAMVEAREKLPKSLSVLQQAQRVLEELPSDFDSHEKARLLALVAPQRDNSLLQLLRRLARKVATPEDRQKAEEGIEAFDGGKVRAAMNAAGDLCHKLRVGSWVTLGSQPEGNGLRQVLTHPEVLGDGQTRVEENIEGCPCVRTDRSSGCSYVYLDVDQIPTKVLREGVYLLLSYLDWPPGTIRIEYDSTADEGRYQRTSALRKFGTRTWRYHVWFLKDARFAGRQNGGADFRVVTRGGRDTYLRWVCVVPVAELRKGQLP